MARILSDCRNELAARLGFGAMVGAGQMNAPILNSFLADAQEQLYLALDWPELVTFDEKQTNVGQAFYDWPANVNLRRILSVAVRISGNLWHPLQRGIEFSHRSVPTSSYPLRYEPTAQQMEVWPVPGAAYTLRRYYVQALGRFTQNDDPVTLEGRLVLLFALANAKAHYKHSDAQLYFKQAEDLLTDIKNRSRRNTTIRKREDAFDLYAVPVAPEQMV